MEVSTDSCQDASKGKEAKAPQGKDKDKGKGKASDTTISQPEQVTDPGTPKAQAQDFSFYSVFIFLCLLFLYHLFFIKEMHHTFAINEDMFFLFNLNLNSMYCYIRQTEHIIN